MASTAYRHFIYGFSAVAIGLSALVYLFNFIIDPLQYYRTPGLRVPRYFPYFQRYQNVGLARTQSYDTVVIGSSLTENFLPSHVARIWNVRPLKLSISGSTLHEESLILDQALATGQVRNVLWVLDYGNFMRPADAVRDDQGLFPYYMYRRPAFLNVEYPLSLDTTRLSINAQFRGYAEANLDKLDIWYDRFTFGREIVLRGWAGNCASFQQKYRPGSVPERSVTTRMNHTLDVNVLNAVHSHPDVKFIFVLPPVSTLYYIPANSGVLNGSIFFRKMLVERLSEATNVRLFDFAIDRQVTDDLDNYKDLIHYDIQINDLMLRAISADEYRLRSDNLGEHISKLIAEVNEYDLCQNGQKLIVPQPVN